jgi:hypothetical protein
MSIGGLAIGIGKVARVARADRLRVTTDSPVDELAHRLGGGSPRRPAVFVFGHGRPTSERGTGSPVAGRVTPID